MSPLRLCLAHSGSYTVSFFDSNVKVDQMSQIVVTEERLLTITTVDQLMSYINGKYNSKYVAWMY